jgi:Putative prokaryotic signal transducing protein
MARHDDILDNLDFDPEDPEHNLESINPQDQVQVVGKFYTRLQADIAMARLRQEGIPCVLQNANSQGMLPDFQSFMSVFVRTADAPVARQIISELQSNFAQASNDSDHIFSFENLLLGFIIIIIIRLAVVAMGS